jgi:3-(3-hydroxy-phenyl)propionate hydroxylase/6-hydroxy-3-succinoylpyridine 3-monooxygenase
LVLNATQVIVCGAGPSGLLAGFLLASHGIDVTIIEAAPGVDDSPRAVVHHFPTFNAFKALGFTEDFAAEGFIGGQAGFHMPDHQFTVKVPFEGALLGQGAICRFLLERLSRQSNARVMWNTRLVDLSDDTDKVSATVEQDGERKIVTGDWFIGADGAHSTTRKLCGLDFQGHTWPERVYATNLEFDFASIGLGDATFWCSPEFSGVVVRLDNRGNWRVAFKDSTTDPVDNERDHILSCLTHFIPPERTFNLHSFAPYNTHQRAVSSMRQGRVLLIGDAAHITCPWGGLGLTTAFWDAFILGDLLAEVMNKGLADAALDQFSQSRLSIFWDVTSAQATANRRLLQETDEQQRQQDMAQLQAFTHIPQAKANFEKTFVDIAGDPILAQSRWLDII